MQIAFERAYITPLRELQQWYETIDGMISSLSSTDEDTLISAADSISDAESLSETITDDVAELASRLDQLTAIVGDYTPDEVDHIGVLPGDRQIIDRRLEHLIEQRELNIETTETGVIIR